MAKQLAAQADSELDIIPDWMKDDVGKGTERFDQSDLEIPRLKLIQAVSSKELQTFNALRPGNFLHTASDRIFDGPVRVVPLYGDRRYILWNPRDSGGGILARADDGVHWNPAGAEFTVKLDKKEGGQTVTWRTAKTVAQSKLADWGSKNPADPNSQPAATLMYNYLMAFPDFPDEMPAVVTFQRSTVKVGKRFTTKLRTIQLPSFALMFEMRAVPEQNRSGDSFYSISLQGAGRVTDEARYREYKAIYEMVSKVGINIKDLEDEDPIDHSGDIDDGPSY